MLEHLLLVLYGFLEEYTHRRYFLSSFVNLGRKFHSWGRGERRGEKRLVIKTLYLMVNRLIKTYAWSFTTSWLTICSLCRGTTVCLDHCIPSSCRFHSLDYRTSAEVEDVLKAWEGNGLPQTWQAKDFRTTVTSRKRKSAYDMRAMYLIAASMALVYRDGMINRSGDCQRQYHGYGYFSLLLQTASRAMFGLLICCFGRMTLHHWRGVSMPADTRPRHQPSMIALWRKIFRAVEDSWFRFYSNMYAAVIFTRNSHV